MTDSSTSNTVVLGGAAQESGSLPLAEGDIQTALPIGTRIGEFEIIGLVGEGGFGIVYLAKDHSLQRQVALKEYMPASLATRGLNSTVSVRSERLQETFEMGRRSFVNEARLLAQFDHPSLVKVYRFWEANGTAYMVMPFYNGTTLRDLLQKNAEVPDENWLKHLLDPITRALATIHSQNCYHRDIAPDNIILLREGRPVLLDFGAARRVIGDMTQALTVILKPGYAPIEQYAEMPNMKQGPWTDIYALAAVVYYAMLRRLPPPSVSRIMQDNYEPLTGRLRGRYSAGFLKGIDLCLAVRPEQRPQTIDEMRALLGIQTETAAARSVDVTPVVTKRPTAPSLPAEEEIIADIDLPVGKKKTGWLFAALALGMICLAVLVSGWIFLLPDQNSTPAASRSGQKPAPVASTSVPAVASTGSLPRETDSSGTKPDALAPGKQAATALHLEPADTGTPETHTSASTSSSGLNQSQTLPAHRSNRTVKSTSREVTDSSERDYLHKVNKDLDEMLQ